MPEYKYTQKELDQSLKLYRGGLSCKEVEVVTDVHWATVRRIARQTGAIRPKNYFRISAKKRLEIIQLYVQERQSRRQIAKQIGVDQYVIYRFLKKKGLLRERGKAISLAQKGRSRK